MTGKHSISRSIALLQASISRNVLGSAALILTLAIMGVATYLLLSHGSGSIRILYMETINSSSRFMVHNEGRSDAFVRFTRFVVSTAKFGNLESDQFETRLPDAGRSLPAATNTLLTVDAPHDTEEYFCSSLRSIGFFAQYGFMKNGKLVPNGQAPSSRIAQVLGDLTCWFNISDQDSSDTSNGKRMLPVRCRDVIWISNCVSQVISSSPEE